MNKILVGKNTAVGTPTNPTNVPDGALAIFNSDTNAILNPGDTISDASSIYIVQGTAIGTNPIVSAPIDGSGVTEWDGRAYVAPIKQVSYVGYSGSGTLQIPALNSSNYLFGVVDTTQKWQPFNPKSTSITSDSSTTPYEIAQQVATSVNTAVKANPSISDPNNWVVKVDVLCSQSSTIITGTVTATNDSTIVTASSGSSGITVGSQLRIGSATATTSPIYDVLSVNGTTIILNRPFQGVTAAGVAAGKLDATPDINDFAGLEVTAIDFGTYFNIYLDDSFETTVVTDSIPFTPSSGSYSDILAYERQTRGDWGDITTVILPLTRDFYAVAGETYSQYHIGSFKTIIDRSFGVGTATVISNISFALPSGATAVKSAFEATLNPWMASTSNSLSSVNI